MNPMGDGIKQENEYYKDLYEKERLKNAELTEKLVDAEAKVADLNYKMDKLRNSLGVVAPGDEGPVRAMVQLAEKIGVCLLGGEEYNKLHDSVMIVAGLHDLGKAGAFGKPFYVPNMIQDGRPTKKDPEQKYKQSEKKPWERNKELAAIGHAERSVVMAMREIELTEDEWFAIRYHDGLYERANSELIGHETPLMMILHWADMWASRILETKTGSTEEKGE